MNNENLEVYPLFAKTIVRTQVDLEGTDLSKIEWVQNYQNNISTSQAVLDDPQFIKLRKECMKGINDYFHGVMKVSEDTEIYITESWFNKTNKGQTHHRHWHPNSTLSAIVFMSGESNKGGNTSFITSQYDTLEFDITEANLYNSKSWSVDPAVGTMLIFPSSVEHLVQPYDGDEPRISLSFNTFVRGKLNQQTLTRLEV
jgi:uncharacterized protein (TIGR02466 family)